MITLTKVNNIIIGFGKAGKTLAQFLGERGEETVLIEKSPDMYGGTCINIACIPTKKLVDMAEQKPAGADKFTYYKESIQAKKELRKKMNPANYKNVAETDHVEVIDGFATFKDNKTVSVELSNGGTEEYTADKIYINTGAVPNILPIDGLEVGGNIHTSTTLLEEENFPEKLTILGAGPIGLEFASIYNNFGADVTVLEYGPKESFLSFVDSDVQEVVLESLEERGIQFVFNARTSKIHEQDGGVHTHYSVDGEEHTLQSNAFLMATGRKPATEGLGLENPDIELGERGEVKVNDKLETTVEGVYALGDVKGGPQFTYISLDDFRIIKHQLTGEKDYTKAGRDFPTATFINPPLTHVGLTEKAAKEAGKNVKIAKMPVAAIPKAMILGKKTGIFKVMIDADTNYILGATLYGEEAHEMINLFTTAINHQIDYRALRDQIYTHPTMTESLNGLLGV